VDEEGNNILAYIATSLEMARKLIAAGAKVGMF
jgi:hypothetical protein